MSITLALDIYGTLINPDAIKTDLQAHVGNKTDIFAQTWRTKQLEYTFRRGLMGSYCSFPKVTQDALDFTCKTHDIEISQEDKNALMDKYLALEAFSDVAPALAQLHQKGAKLYAFSNGLTKDISSLLAHAGLNHNISSIVSANEVQTFKPDPGFYAHFLEQAQTTPASTWLVSSNPFDVIGAAACGWRTVWVKRKPSAVFDPWEQTPTLVVNKLTELPEIPVLWEAG